MMTWTTLQGNQLVVMISPASLMFVHPAVFDQLTKIKKNLCFIEQQNFLTTHLDLTRSIDGPQVD